MSMGMQKGEMMEGALNNYTEVAEWLNVPMWRVEQLLYEADIVEELKNKDWYCFHRETYHFVFSLLNWA